MKYIKKREKFLENKNQIKDNALDILASHDKNQDPVLKNALDKLDNVNENSVRVRLAPSPTGFTHVGTIRTALFNYLFAKQNKGKFIIRIEDTDEKRFVPIAEDYIKRTLDWVGIIPDEDPWKGGPYGPYKQSERDYSKHIKTVIEKGIGYMAFDNDEDMDRARSSTPNFAYDAKNRMSMRNSLSLSKEEVDSLLNKNTPYVIRFKMPENKIVEFTDIVRGKVSFNTNQLDDKVLVKSSGGPTFHLCNVCDDHDMKITHVIRGEEWINSTPLHILLYEAFGWDIPQFAHLPLLLNPDGKGKLSKRKALTLGIPVFPFGGKGEDDKGNMVDFKGFKDEGYEPDALVNFLVLLGWSPKDQKEVMTMADMISKFSLPDVHKSGAKFDIDKAKFFNKEYLNNHREDAEILKHIDIGSYIKYDDKKLSEILDICKKRSEFTKDLQSIADIFFNPISLSDAQRKSITEDFRSAFAKFVENADNIDWTLEGIKQGIYDACADTGVKMGKTMPSLRVAVAGGIVGPDLVTTMEILGKDESLIRVTNALI